MWRKVVWTCPRNRLFFLRRLRPLLVQMTILSFTREVKKRIGGRAGRNHEQDGHISSKIEKLGALLDIKIVLVCLMHNKK